MGSKLRRYVPLAAVAYVSIITILQAWGMEGLATQIATVGGLVGLDKLSPVSSTQLLAAAAAFSGVVLKVYSVVREAFDKE